MDSEAGLYVRLRQLGPIPLDVDLSCRDGELLALVGPSGAGKSTVLRAIAGLYRPQAGRIVCAGEVWFDTAAGIDLPPHRRRAGMVFQSYALFPHMTALGNVRAALAHRPRAERTKQARDLLALVHLDRLEHRYPANLSGGQQQRVAVARALAREPAVLLLDEPFSAVDRRTRRKLHAELAEMRQAVRIPIILVTHDLDEAAKLADRICVLDRGETLQTGCPAEVLAKPAGPRVAAALDLADAEPDEPQSK
jgi:molybdate transport system ATP-binding protein